MPLGSSSDAPVMRPGPRASRRRGLLVPTTGLGAAGTVSCLELIELPPQSLHQTAFNTPPGRSGSICRKFVLVLQGWRGGLFRGLPWPSSGTENSRLSGHAPKPANHLCRRASGSDCPGGNSGGHPFASSISGQPMGHARRAPRCSGRRDRAREGLLSHLSPVLRLRKSPGKHVTLFRSTRPSRAC